MDNTIEVHDLWKKYIIRHQQESYLSLRETIARGFKSLGRKSFTTGEKEVFWALQEISLEIKRGDKVGIIGRNGAGKSTLLKVLSRITEPSRGDIVIRGRVASLLEVGTGFHPELTGRENIYLNGAILGMSRTEIKSKFDEIVSFAEVERFLDTPVKRYSSGMYVRLAFAVAAHLEPEILIVDEVLAVGDAQFQKKCMTKMDQVGRDGRTVLFVSHNLGAISELCTTGIYMQNGRIAYQGGIAETLAQYANSRHASQGDISQSSRRGGSGGVSFVKVMLARQDGSTPHVFTNDDALFIHMEADVSEAYIQRSGLVIAVAIDSADEVRLMTCMSSWLEKEYTPTGSVLRVCCRIDHLPFISGKYHVSVAAIYRSETLDMLQYCTQFEIVNEDNSFSRGRMTSHGHVSVPFDFELTEA